jgi:hypothetical protein
MLFPIPLGTPNSAVFTALNNELGYFLTQCIRASVFDPTLFSPTLRNAIWNNAPTRTKFRMLWNLLEPLPEAIRLQLSQSFTVCQNVSIYYSNTAIAFSQIIPGVEPAFAALSKHLFNHTCKLVDVEAACVETVQDHFNLFRSAAFNGNICCCCGTEALAQYRTNVDEDDQWRGPYDHLLAKEKYPVYAVHPDNLLPICHTCNSKAKLAKDLLRGSSGHRRRCFHPQTENAYANVALEVDIAGIAPIARTIIYSNDAVVMEKLETWNDVYCIKDRVEGEFGSLIEKLAQDCAVSDYANFRAQLMRKATLFRDHCRLTAWNFWKYKLYDWLDQQSDAVIQSVWAGIQAKLDDPSAAEVYGI